MALLAGVLLSRRQISMDKECGLDIQCRGCSSLRTCKLPEAEKERRDEKG
jgi:hypothetical protein